MFADAVRADGWPYETEGPAQGLYNGGNNTFMERFTAARYFCVAPNTALGNTNATSGMIGGIEVVFVDGHAGSGRLQPLRAFDWHNNWVVPSNLPVPK